MNIFRKVLSIALVAAMLFSMASLFTGCGKDPAGTDNPTDPASGDTVAYSVTIKTAGGMPMAGIAAYVYADSTLADLKNYGETNENGTVSFTLPGGADYAIDLEGVPKGYEVENFYTFNGTNA